MGKSLHTFDCHELLARFDNKREGLVLIYLLAMADDGGWVDSSVYNMARLLNLHRQTLNRIIQRLCQKGYAVWDRNDSKRLRVGFHVEATTEPADLETDQGISQDDMTADKMDSEGSGKMDVTSGVTTLVTDDVTDNVTVLNAQNDTIKHCLSGKYKDKEFLDVTGTVTGVVTGVVTQKETKENKEEIPPAPPKEEKKQKKEKTPAITHTCEKNFKPSMDTPSLNLFYEPEFSVVETEYSAVGAEFSAVEPCSSSSDAGSSAYEPSSSASKPEFSVVESDFSASEAESSVVESEFSAVRADSTASEPESSPVKPESPAAEPTCAKKSKQGRAKRAETLEQRRQRFLDKLSSYAGRYGEEMIKDFGDYWTETNRSNTQMRFELQRTWNTSLRLARWAKNEQTFNNKNTNYDKIHQPTSADYIRDAQLEAIRATEQFIREAERRRGGVPPHLPF